MSLDSMDDPTPRDENAIHPQENALAALGDAIVRPVTLLRIPAVHTTRAWVERGVNVEVVGTRVSGKTSFLNDLHQVLADNGWTVVRIDGLRTLRDQPLEALAVARLIEGGRPIPSVTAVVDHLQDDWAEKRIVVLVDDVDCLDRASCGVLESLTRRMPLQIVSTGPLRAPDPADRSVFRLPHPCAELTLRPWRFEELNGLLTGKFGQVADPWLAGRIHQHSGGVPGFALAMLEAAELESRLTVQDDVLSSVDTLWYEGLPRVVEDYIGQLPADERATLESLSAWGPLAAAEACRLVPPDHLRSLERRKLLTVVRTGHHVTVVVFPPVVSEYLNQRRGDMHAYLTTRAGGLEGPAEGPSPAPDADAPYAPRSESPGALSRVMSSQRDTEGVHLASAWEESPTTSTAMPYIAWLVGSSDTRREIDDVAARTGWDDGAPILRCLTAMDLARWEASAGNGLAAALEVIESHRDGAGPFAAMLDHVAIQLGIVDGDVPEYDEGLIPIDDAMPEEVRVSAWATRAYLALVTGHMAEALTASERMGTIPERPRTALIRILALCANGEAATALDVARDSLEWARSTHDEQGIYLCGYATAYALQCLGHRQEAAEVLDLSLSLGRPRPDLEPLYQAQLIVAARLAMQAMDGYRALSLGRQALALGLREGPLPAMSANVVGLVGERGPVHEIPQESWHQVEEMWGRRYRYAAISSGLWLTEIVPDGERAAIVLGWIREIGAQGLEPSGEYVVALAAQDPERLLGCAAGLVETGWSSRATVALNLAEEWFHAQGDPAAAMRAKAQWARLQMTDPAIELDLSPHQIPSVRLSSREREVVALVARGLSNRQIADELVLSVRTVENHIYRALRKTRLTSRGQLGRLAADVPPTFTHVNGQYA